MSDLRKNQALMTQNLFDRVTGIIEIARSRVVQTVNQELVYAYWAIGREIVLELQGGEERAEYGKRILKDLSKRLSDRFGKGYSELNLNLFRRFYLTYNQKDAISYTVCKEFNSDNSQTSSAISATEIPYTVCRESESKKSNTVCSESEFPTVSGENSIPDFNPKLSWSHYRVLMRVEKPSARAFYEKEAGENSWSVRQLERQVGSLFYERLLKSRDKAGMLAEASTEIKPVHVLDVIKDPYVLEFLGLPESTRLQESDLESALIGALQEFLLELGSGFAFVGRQKRITLDGDHFYPDLIFYHIRLKCYVIVDLKVEKLTHGDIGQMQMYVGYYDQEIKQPDEHSSIGLILCSEKNDAMVKYVLGEQNEQIFASRYRLELPDEETLRRELERERQLIEKNQNESL